MMNDCWGCFQPVVASIPLLFVVFTPACSAATPPAAEAPPNFAGMTADAWRGAYSATLALHSRLYSPAGGHVTFSEEDIPEAIAKLGFERGVAGPIVVFYYNRYGSDVLRSLSVFIRNRVDPAFGRIEYYDSEGNWRILFSDVGS